MTHHRMAQTFKDTGLDRNARSEHGCSSVSADRGIDEADENNAIDAREGAEQTKPLSKNAQKRLLREERWRNLKLMKKVEKKEKRQQQTKEKRKEWEDKLASLSAEEREKLLQKKRESRQARKQNRLQKKDKLRQAMDCGQNLVLDLEFCERMEPNELVSLVQQVMYSYAANAKASYPVRLSLTGCKGPIKAHLEKIPGFSNWLLHNEERSYSEVFDDRKSDLVYLTADSEHTLHQLDESRIYIIGGLVDRNRWKGLTYEKAMHQGILTAKLPISEHMKMASSQVLTVNQVVEIVLAFHESKDWAKALLEVIPQRKRAVESEVCVIDRKDVYFHANVLSCNDDTEGCPEVKLENVEGRVELEQRP